MVSPMQSLLDLKELFFMNQLTRRMQQERHGLLQISWLFGFTLFVNKIVMKFNDNDIVILVKEDRQSQLPI